MAMNIGQSNSASGDLDVMMEMNTTPLIDVMLVLLVMLIITIPLNMHAVSVEMPQASEQQPLEIPKVINIKVNANRQILWNDTLVLNQGMLEQLMMNEEKQAKQAEIHFLPERGARYEDVAGVMATAQRLKLKQIGIANIDELFSPTSSTSATPLTAPSPANAPPKAQKPQK
jgi:biopolymer transport protein ExbD